MRLCDKIAALRAQHGLNQRQFAAKLGISAAFVCGMEIGRAKVPPGIVTVIASLFPIDKAEWMRAGARERGWDV